MPITMHGSNSRRRIILAALLTYLIVILTRVPLIGSAKLYTSRPGRMQQQSAPQYLEGELLVRFRGGVPQRDQDAIIARHGAQKKKDLRGESGVAKLKVSGQDVRTVALQMLLDPQVEFAEPNFLIGKDEVVPSDSRFNEQWMLRNTGQNSGQAGSDINAVDAWETTTGSRSTVALTSHIPTSLTISG